MKNLANNLSKMSDKNNSKAVIGQFKSLFRKLTNIPSTSVTKVYLWSQPPVRGAGGCGHGEVEWSATRPHTKDNGPPSY